MTRAMMNWCSIALSADSHPSLNSASQDVLTIPKHGTCIRLHAHAIGLPPLLMLL